MRVFVSVASTSSLLAGDVIVSLSRPEVRAYYNLERRWLGFAKYEEQREEQQHKEELLQG